jgi:hypothetical protein
LSLEINLFSVVYFLSPEIYLFLVEFLPPKIKTPSKVMRFFEAVWHPKHGHVFEAVEKKWCNMPQPDHLQQPWNKLNNNVNS